MALRRGSRRLLWLGVLVGLVVGVRKAVLSRREPAVLGPPPSWPPLQPSEPPVAAVGDLVTGGATEHHAARPSSLADVVAEGITPDPEDPAVARTEAAVPWVAADGGQCPLSHPIKVNTNSGIYHLPGSRFYARTKAERCYAEATVAEADGYRAAKVSGSETT